MNASDKTPRKRIRRTLSFLGKPLDGSHRKREDPQSATAARVTGPYYNAERDTYRIVVFDGLKRKALTTASEKEALKLKAELEGQLARCDRTIGDALDEFLADRGQAFLPMGGRKTVRHGQPV